LGSGSRGAELKVLEKEGGRKGEKGVGELGVS